MTDLLVKNNSFALDLYPLDKNIAVKMLNNELTIFPFLSFLQILLPRFSMSSDRTKAEITSILIKEA
jgi:hypothetical protein